MDDLTRQAFRAAVREIIELQPTTFDGLSTRVEEEIERTYWEFDAKHKGRPMPMSERDAFKHAVREMFLRLRAPLNGSSEP